jgi:hypothetical protein
MMNTDFVWTFLKFAYLYKYSLYSTFHITFLHILCYLNRFVASARQLAKALEVPLVNDLGYTKRYVRCLQVYFCREFNNFFYFCDILFFSYIVFTAG